MTREEQRFEAAKAAMQAIFGCEHWLAAIGDLGTADERKSYIARLAVVHADDLLEELYKEKEK